MANPLVIDISHYQPQPDWAALKAAGTIGVIMKGTQGTTYLDPTFKSRRVLADVAGLCYASYHYLVPNSIEAQMDFYVKSVLPQKGERLIIDYEDPGLKIVDLETAIKRLWAIAPDCEITVYAGNGFLGSQLKGANNPTLAQTSLWVASYTTASQPTTKDMKGTWPIWSLWQYSDKEKVTGLSSTCDASKWNGDPAALPGWFHTDNVTPKPDPTPPVPPTDDKVVAMELTVPDGVTLKVTVNGKLLV